MFCRNCGTDVTDMKYCPKCGTPTTIANENPNTDAMVKGSKTNRKYVLAILGVGIVLLGIAIAAFLRKPSTETVNDHITNDTTSRQTSQATEETTAEETKEEITTQNWWKDKAFRSTDSGLYFWIEEDGTNLWFIVGSEYLNDQTCQVIGYVDKSEVSVDINREDEFVRYRFHDDTLNTNNSVQYFYNKNEVLLLSKSNLNDQWSNYSDTYLSVEGDLQSDEVYEETNETPAFSYEPLSYECFETKGGLDAEIVIYYSDTNESIAVDIIGITGGNLSLENGIYSGYWEDFDSQVSLVITDNSPEITFTATGELEQYNGTYIQLPDLGTDGEN